MLEVWEVGGWEATVNGYRVSFWGDESVLKLDGVTIYHQLHNSVNILKTTELYTLEG